MTTPKIVRRLPFTLLALAVLAAAGCGSGRGAFRQAERAAERELWDQAVLSYAKAVSEEPGNTRFRVALDRAKMRAATQHFDRGKRYVAAGQWELAIKELQQAVILDPANQYAVNELTRANSEMERRRRGPSPLDVARAEAERRAAEVGPPKLDPTSNIVLGLKFPDTTIQQVYDVMSRSAGINFLYDEKLDLKKKISVDLANVTFEQALDVLMLMNKHFYKVIDAHTLLIAEDVRQKHQEYDDHVIRTFYLSNSETQEVQTLLRSLLETRRLAENKNLNAITIKDTPEKIKVAERIIKANDKAKGEVVIDIELLEINRVKAQKLGIDLNAHSLSLVFGDGKQFVPLNNLRSLNIQAAWSLGPIPSVLIDFMRSDTDSKVIARPQLRILEGENGKITIGDRVPIPATSFNTSQTIGGNIVPITSFTYQNVGIIVEVKPRVHHNKEVTLDVKTEVSSLAGNVTGTGGVSQPIIGTRSVETTIRLQDGETNLLAGLIKEEERQSLSGVPGLSQIPILRRLFGTTQTDATDTDIVLSITPHIVRVPNIEPLDLVPLWVGSEEQVQLRGVARNALGESPFASGAQWEEVERDLRGETGEPEPSAQPPAAAKPGAARPGAAKPGAAKPGAATQNRVESGPGGQAGGSGAGAPSGRGGGEPVPAEPQPPPGRRVPRGETPPPPPPGDATAPGAEGGAPPADVPPGEQPPADEGAAPPADTGAGAGEAEPPRPRAASQVRLAPDRPQVAVGDAVAVDVLVAGADNVGVVNFQLRYDPRVLRFVPPGQQGDFLAQGGAPVELQVVEGAEGGLIVVHAARSGGAGASGGGRLVRLNFVALSPGTAGFGFAVAQVRAPDNRALPAQFRVAGVEVIP